MCHRAQALQYRAALDAATGVASPDFNPNADSEVLALAVSVETYFQNWRWPWMNPRSL